MMALDATQETRVAEINAALRKGGGREIQGSERRALLDELAGLLGAGESQPAPLAPLAPEKQARLDQIRTRLMDNATGKPGGFIGAVERARLCDEMTDLSSEPPPPAGEGGAA